MKTNQNQGYLSNNILLSMGSVALGVISLTTVGGLIFRSYQSPAVQAAESSSAAASGITEEEVLAAQEAWGDGIVAIGEAFTKGDDYKSVARDHVDTLYAYDAGSVLFKPTKAAQEQFRLNEDNAVSYFVTGSVPEDHGFAIQPWTKVRFENANIIIDSDSAIAMGNYYFTDTQGKEAKVEYTFGYVEDENGDLLINLHHSSFPYQPAH